MSGRNILVTLPKPRYSNIVHAVVFDKEDNLSTENCTV